MGYIIIVVVVLWCIWALVAYLFSKIKDTIENYVINKYASQNEIKKRAENINETLISQIAQSKLSIGTFRETAFKHLPDLKDRIARDNRRQDYIQNVLRSKNRLNYRRNR